MKKYLAFFVSLLLVMSLATPAMASGEASGAMGFGVYDVNLLADTAAISVIDGVVKTDSVEAGEISADQISGVRASFDGIGDWDGTETFGHTGILISSEEATTFTIGGAEDVYEVDGQGYNTVITLGAEDKNEVNALGGSDVRDYKDASEGAEGAGVYADVSDLVIDNAYIFTEGYGRSAIHLRSTVERSVIKNSTIVALGSDGADSSAPGFICMYASSRPVLIESSGNTYFYNDDLISSDWGVYSLDGCYGANVYIVDCYSENRVGGYSMYALGFAEGEENSSYFYGSYAASAQFGTILCAAGRTYTGDLEDATRDALALSSGVELRDTVLDNGWSYIGGVTNAVTMQADMSSATTVGIFSAHHTILDTANVVDRDGNPLDDTMDLYDYLDDMSIGASQFFLDYIHGSAIAIRSENVDLTLDDCVVTSSTGVAVQTVIGYDTGAANIKVPDGTEYYGSTVTVKDMALTGDILHEDYQRKMVLSLENAQLEGAVVSGTRAAWEQNIAAAVADGWNDECDELGLDAQAIVDLLAEDKTYETVWGVRMSLDGDSTWTVTGDSSLYSLEVADGAVIEAPAGASLEIYVDCQLSNEDAVYDYTTGIPVSALTAGTYSGVVIRVVG
jgi:hypothetical protein